MRLLVRGRYPSYESTMTATAAGSLALSNTSEPRHFTRKSIETQSVATVLLNEDLQIVAASKSYYSDFKKTMEETEGAFLYDICNKQYSAPALKYFLHSVVERKQTLKNFQLNYECEIIGKRVLFLNAEKVTYENSQGGYILLTVIDLTHPAKR